MNTYERVRRVLIDEMDCLPESVTSDAALVHLGMDSMDGAMLILQLEEEFGIQIPDDDFHKFVTVQDVAEYCCIPV